jgi:hypothetical protein
VLQEQGERNNEIVSAKNEWPGKARNVLYDVCLLLFEQGPNPARSEDYLCYQAHTLTRADL